MWIYYIFVVIILILFMLFTLIFLFIIYGLLVTKMESETKLRMGLLTGFQGSHSSLYGPLLMYGRNNCLTDCFYRYHSAVLWLYRLPNDPNIRKVLVSRLSLTLFPLHRVLGVPDYGDARDHEVGKKIITLGSEIQTL